MNFSSSDMIYVGAILTKKSQKLLYEFANKKIGVPDEWTKYCHHMTIKFKPQEEYTLGENVTLIVEELFHDEKGIAVKVDPNMAMPADQTPHVTIATAPGVPPVYSNMLIKTKGERLNQVFRLEAFVGAKLRRGIVIPEREDAAFENL